MGLTYNIQEAMELQRETKALANLTQSIEGDTLCRSIN